MNEFLATSSFLPADDSIAKPKLHGELVFTFFEFAQVAVFLDDAAIAPVEPKMQRGDRQGKCESPMYSAVCRLERNQQIGRRPQLPGVV